jgi:hypothetical protein
MKKTLNLGYKKGNVISKVAKSVFLPTLQHLKPSICMDTHAIGSKRKHIVSALWRILQKLFYSQRSFS